MSLFEKACLGGLSVGAIVLGLMIWWLGQVVVAQREQLYSLRYQVIELHSELHSAQLRMQDEIKGESK